VDPLSIAGLLGTTVGGIGSLVSGFQQGKRDEQNYQLQKDIASKNYEMQKQHYGLQLDAMDWQKWSQAQTWKREDTAVQRRMFDLKQAGINPLLAAGSAAQTSGPIRPQTPSQAPQQDTPQRQGGALEAVAGMLANVNAMMMQTLTQVTDISKTQAQTLLTEQQKNKTAVESDYLSRTLHHRVNAEDYRNLLSITKNRTDNVIEGMRESLLVGSDTMRGNRDLVFQLAQSRIFRELYENALRAEGASQAEIKTKLDNIDLEFRELEKGTGVGGQIFGALMQFLRLIL